MGARGPASGSPLPRGAGRAARRLRRVAAWLCASAVIGVVCGAGAVALSLLARLAALAFRAHAWLVWLLPLAAVASLRLYRALRVSWATTTNTVLLRASVGGAVSGALAPAILLGTTLTLLCGGSVGKEAAALQLGGSLGSAVGGRLLDRWDLGAEDGGTFIRAGMAGAFASLMSAPVAAALFVLEVTVVRLTPRSVLTALVAALCGYAVAALTGVRPPWVAIASTVSPMLSLGATLEVTAACVAMALAFCLLLDLVRRASLGPLARPVPRAVAGGLLVAVIMTALDVPWLGGTGELLMSAAFGGGVPASAFALKALLTLLVLGAGYKGGEIMPVMSIGAALGCTVGTLVGVHPGGCAAIGLVAMLSACTNAPLASALLGMEAFGAAMGPQFLLAALLAHLLTLYMGLYPANRMPSLRALLRSYRRRVDPRNACARPDDRA